MRPFQPIVVLSNFSKQHFFWLLKLFPRIFEMVGHDPRGGVVTPTAGCFEMLLSSIFWDFFLLLELFPRIIEMVGHDPRDGGRDPRLTNWSTDRWMNICDFLVRRLWPAEKVDRTQRNFGLNFLVSRFCGGQVSSKVVPSVSSSASSSWFSSETETKPRAVDSWRLDEAISLARRVEPMKQWRCLIFLVRYATNLGRPAVCDISKHSSEIRRPISVPPLGGRLFIDEPSIGHRTASCTAVGRWLPRFFFPLRFTQFGVSWLFFF